MNNVEPAGAGASTGENATANVAPPGAPRRAIWIALGIAAVLGIGGAFADHSFDVAPAPSATTVVHTSASPSRSLAQFIGLTSLGSKPAPDISLTGDSGGAFSLRSLIGHPVIVTFLGARCGGICPVVTAELQRAQRDLGTRAQRDLGTRVVHSAVVIVNADPRAVFTHNSIPQLSPSVLIGLRQANFVDGSLAQMQHVWKSYGVTIELDPQSGALAFTNVIYLIDPKGRLRYALTPFANESRSGDATLPSVEIERFANGIATYMRRIAR